MCFHSSGLPEIPSVTLIHLLISGIINDALGQDMRHDCTLRPSVQKYRRTPFLSAAASPSRAMILPRYLVILS